MVVVSVLYLVVAVDAKLEELEGLEGQTDTEERSTRERVSDEDEQSEHLNECFMLTL